MDETEFTNNASLNTYFSFYSNAFSRLHCLQTMEKSTVAYDIGTLGFL